MIESFLLCFGFSVALAETYDILTQNDSGKTEDVCLNVEEFRPCKIDGTFALPNIDQADWCSETDKATIFSRSDNLDRKRTTVTEL